MTIELESIAVIAQPCLILFDPKNCSTPGLPVPHHLMKFVQVHVCCIGDAIQPSHPLMPSSPSVLSLSQYQGLSRLLASDDQNIGASASLSRGHHFPNSLHATQNTHMLEQILYIYQHSGTPDRCGSLTK